VKSVVRPSVDVVTATIWGLLTNYPVNRRAGRQIFGFG
jgi:hypothetical protein